MGEVWKARDTRLTARWLSRCCRHRREVRRRFEREAKTAIPWRLAPEPQTGPSVPGTRGAPMRRVFVAFSLAVVALGASPADRVPAEPAAHPAWIGELRIGARAMLTELRFTSDQRTLRGAVAYPERGEEDLPMSDISSTPGRVCFTWRDGTEQLAFDGRMSHGLLSGRVRSVNESGILRLAPIIHLDRAAEERFTGYYEMNPGQLLSITSFPFG